MEMVKEKLHFKIGFKCRINKIFSEIKVGCDIKEAVKDSSKIVV